MSPARKPNQLRLFENEPDPPPRPVGPWRAVAGDTWTEDAPPEVLERGGPEVMRRNLQFLRAIELHGRGAMATEVDRFRRLHDELVHGLARWRTDASDSTDGGSVEPATHAASVLKALRELTGLRLRILEGLPTEAADKVMSAETRVRVREFDLERALRLAEFSLAEERGEVVAIEIPLQGPGLPAGLIGPEMVGSIARAFMDGKKREQERRPLPARQGLGPMLRDLPVQWLDAIWDALDMGEPSPRHRKARERRIAEHLTDGEALARIVTDRLSVEERRLLAYVLDQGGRVSASALTRRFGGDDGDGWFWDEDPPTSTLGRVRLHGLAYVGVPAEGRRMRTVLVPQELRNALGEALTDETREALSEGAGGESRSLSEERSALGDLARALEDAYPDGVIDVVWEEDEVDAPHDALRRSVADIPDAQLLYDSSEDGGAGPSWAQDDEDFLDDGDDEFWGWDDIQRSYRVFFVSPRGMGFEFPVEHEIVDEQGHEEIETGTGRVGLAVAVSYVGPFALLRVTSLETTGEGVISSPDIELRMFDEEGRPVPADRVLLEVLGEEERRRMEEVREALVNVLESSGHAVLGDEDLRRPVPELDAESNILVGVDEGSLTVEDAFFFRYL
jgi:hypothetical protein